MKKYFLPKVSNSGTMKRIFSLFTAICLLSLSCSENDEKTLTLSKKSVEFTSNGGEQEVAVTANTNWEVSYGANWFEVDAIGKMGNGKIVIRAESNNTAVVREANIIVTALAAGINEEIIITQEAGEAKFLVRKITSGSFSTEFEYDHLNRFTRMIGVNAHGTFFTTFFYDADGNLTGTLQTGGQNDVSFTYTMEGNTITSLLEGFEYEEEGTFEINDKGQIVNIPGFQYFTYDAAGNINSRRIVEANRIPPRDYTHIFEYNNNPSPFAHVNMPSWWLVLHGIYDIANNSTKGVLRTWGEFIRYTAEYEYNDDGYPEKVTVNRNENDIIQADLSNRVPTQVISTLTYIQAN